MLELDIKPFINGKEKEIFHLIKHVYDEYVAPDYTDEGNQVFYDWIDAENIARRQGNQNNLWYAEVNGELAGMIEIRDNTNISLLFVVKKYMRQGIAGKLFNKALDAFVQRDPNLEKIYVHASPYSIDIYKKLGFIETDSMQEEMGIKYLPMEMDISQW